MPEIKFWYGGKKHSAKSLDDQERQIQKMKNDGTDPYVGLLAAEEIAALAEKTDLIKMITVLSEKVSQLEKKK